MKSHAGVLQVETFLKSCIELCGCQGSVEWRKGIGAGARSSCEGGKLLSHDRHWVLRCNPRNADRTQGQSLLIGSSAAQNAAILDPAKFVREIGFVIRATFSVS